MQDYAQRYLIKKSARLSTVVDTLPLARNLRAFYTLLVNNELEVNGPWRGFVNIEIIHATVIQAFFCAIRRNSTKFGKIPNPEFLGL